MHVVIYLGYLMDLLRYFKKKIADGGLPNPIGLLSTGHCMCKLQSSGSVLHNRPVPGFI